MHDALKPWKPTKDDPWDFDAACHLWRRAGFGAPPKKVEETLSLPVDEAVRRMVRGPDKDPATDELEAIYRSVRGTGTVVTARAWLITRMVRCEYQLREKMALFWHGHFATSIRKVRDVDWMLRQYRIFLDQGLAPFPRLLHSVTRDPAMIRWLDNETNSKGQPNENFARELFELFTLGDGNYTERDIQEAGRAFTGWHILHDAFHFSRGQHDTGVKTVLGETGRLGGEDVMRLALAQKACGNFLAAKLLRFFVEPDPSQELVEALGAAMRENGYDLPATLELLFASRAFFASSARRSLVKSPLEYVVGTVRALEIPVKVEELLPDMSAMGQDLLAPPNVKGWPGHRTWINTATWLTRINAAHRLTRALEQQGHGDKAVDKHGRALLGRLPAHDVRMILLKSGTENRDLVHALLALPETHLN